MPQDQLLQTILGALVVASMALLAAILLRTGRRRRSGRREVGLAPRGDAVAGEDPRSAAKIEAFLAGVAGDAAGRARPPSPWELIPPRREAVTAAAPQPPQTPDRVTAAPPQPPETPDRAPAGLADPGAWDRAIREESARVARFGRPATVVMAELHSLDDVADRLGRDVADRVVAETARLLVAHGRAVDRIVWLGDARFGALLVETDEVVALGYVERVRAAADGWFESAELSIRLSLGWASTVAGGDVIAAAAVAQQRMYDADRRASSTARRSWRAPTPAVSEVTARSNPRRSRQRDPESAR